MEVNGNDQILVHHGIDGQKWGKRKYQYEDGSLTPLGRIHYGVGEARDRSKIKMREERAKAKAEAKVVKAKAKAEIQKIRAAAKADAEMAKAKAEAYKAKKDADEQTERERIRADVEMDRNFGREQTRQMELQRQADKDLAKAQADAAVEQTKVSEGKHTALKALGITLAAVGIGYLAYKAVSGFSSGNTSEAGKKVASELGDKPASEVINKANKIEAKFNKSDAKTIAKELARQDKAVKAAIKADKIKETESYINKLQNAAKADETQKKVQAAKELVARSEMAKVSSSAVKSSGQSDFLKSILAKEAQKKASSVSNSSNWNHVETFFDKHGNEIRKLFHGGFLMVGDKILIHSDELYHHGIKGQRWGLRRWQYEDGTLTPEGRLHYGRRIEKKARKSQGYENISNTTLALRPWNTALSGLQGAGAGALIAEGVVGGAGSAATGALIGGPLGAISAFGATTLVSFLAKKFSQRNERQVNKMIAKVENKKAKEFIEESKEAQEKEDLSYTQLQNRHNELEQKIKAEKDPLQKRFLQQELTQVTLKLNDELEKKNKQKYD